MEGHDAKTALKQSVDLQEQLLIRVYIEDSSFLANAVLKGMEGGNLGWSRLIVCR